MKKLVSLLLALGLLLACVPALAEAPALDLLFADTPMDIPYGESEHAININYGGSIYDVYYFCDNHGTMEYDNSNTAVTYDEPWYFNTDANSLEWWQEQDVMPAVCYMVGDFGKISTDFYATYIEKDGKPYIRLSLNPWAFDEESQEYVENVLPEDERYINIKDEEIKDVIDGTYVPKSYPATWYPHNTICVAGVEFRDVRPELTDKWYNFAALDLSQDGEQTFDLVAGNMYIIGTVVVRKTGDEVIVDWKLRHQGTNDSNFQLEKEFMTIFSDLNAVTEVEPAKFDGKTYEFGQTISIANDLGGDTNVLLYICNQATYCNNLSYKYLKPIYHTRYWPNLSWRVAQREAMMELVNADLAK